MTQDEIIQMIDDEASTHLELNELQNNSSLVAFWNASKKIYAFIALYVIGLFEQHKTDVNDLIDTTEVGSIDWYIAMISEYQHGDQLIIVDNRPQYSVEDTSLQIIKHVSAKEVFDQTGYILSFKVLKENNIPLNTTEMAGLTVYVSRRKIPGTWIQMSSLDADELFLNCEATLSALIFDSNGIRISDNTEAVRQGIIEFLAEKFPFGGVLYLSQLISHIKSIDGVEDFYIYGSDLSGVVFVKSIEAPAGHIKLNNQSTINYVLL